VLDKGPCLRRSSVCVLWFSWVFPRGSWISMDAPWCLLGSCVFLGAPGYTPCFHGCSWMSPGCPWVRLGAAGCSWVPKGVSQCSWMLLGAPGCSWMFLFFPGCSWGSCLLAGDPEFSRLILSVPCVLVGTGRCLWVFLCVCCMFPGCSLGHSWCVLGVPGCSVCS
jgi:hypothetical protein